MRPRYVYIFFSILIIVLLIVQANVLKINKNTNSTSIQNLKEDLKVTLLLNNEEVTMNLEEYILGVLSCEMPALFSEEALKAGAITARTYALKLLESNPNYIFKGTTTDQCYTEEETLKELWKEDFNTYYSKMKEQVYETKGKYITYNDEIIFSYYFSVSNGYTEDAKEVFKEELEYLTPIESPLDKNTKGYEKTITISKKDFYEKLSLEYNDTLEIKNIQKTKSNRISKITINEKEFTGIEIRKLLNLRSTDFTLEEINNDIKITTKGYGHGVGMSQYGANELAKIGYTYEEIIKYYYKNVDIKEI